jgi:NADPH:quinone reductase-like Zn-dependent oxidoreductase
VLAPLHHAVQFRLGLWRIERSWEVRAFLLSICPDAGPALDAHGQRGTDCRSFAVMMHMVAYGGLRGVVGRTFDLEEAARAHEVTAGRDFFGKLILRVP